MSNMSGTTNLNIRLDSSLKQEADILFKQMGLNMSTAINIFLRQSVNEQRIPFEISTNNFKRELLKALKEAEKISNDSTRLGFDSIDSLIEDLDK